MPVNEARRLVVIQLSGGNDGLNTVIPYRNDNYYRLRPTLSMAGKTAVKINDTLGFNNNLVEMSNLLQKGELSILNGVGYPNPNRSHFRSMDIWHTAADANNYENTGWLGRYLDNNCQNLTDALEISDSLSLALKGKNRNGLAITNPAEFYRSSNSPFFNELNNENKLPEDGSNLNYLYKSIADTRQSAAYVFEKYKSKKATITFPDTRLGKQLKDVARFIGSGIESRVYYVNHTGFDTHANQVPVQNRLLRQMDQAIDSFVRELKILNAFDNTLIMVFSEFGRRPAENGSQGSDHGTANPVFIIGNQLKQPGLYNPLPSLTDLDKNGDLLFSIDFRRTYATILKNWLQVSSKPILKGDFSGLGFI